MKVLARLPCVALLLASACATRDVVVGDAPASLDLAECFGDGTVCTDRPPVVGRRTLEVPMQTLDCPLDPERPELDIAWSQASEWLYPTTVAAPDGALWLAGVERMSDPEYPAARAILGIECYRPDGQLAWDVERQFFEEHDFARLTVGSLAHDVRGHGFIALNTVVADQARGWLMIEGSMIIEIDDQGRLVGEPTEVTGVSELQVATAQGGDLMLIARSTRGSMVLGRLAPDRTVRWIQNNVQHGRVTQILGDAQRTLVLGDGIESELGALLPKSLAQYDDRGNLVWEVNPARDMTATLGPQGGITLFGDTPSPRRFGPAVGLLELDVRSELRSAFVFDQALSYAAGPPAADAQGNLELVMWEVPLSGAARSLTLRRITADRTRCTKTLLRGGGPAPADTARIARGGVVYWQATTDTVSYVGAYPN